MKQGRDITVILLGVEVDPNKVKNRKLREIIRTRVHDGEKFLFNYGDHRDHRYGDHGQHSEYREYGDHVDHKDRHKDTHRDGMSHRDWGGGGYHDDSGYSDGTSHRDSGYSEHTDHNR